MINNSPRSAPAASSATSNTPTAPCNSPSCTASPTPPKQQHHSTSAKESRRRSTSTSITIASTSVTSPKPPRMPSPPGPRTWRPALTPSCSPPPASWSPNSTVAPETTASTTPRPHRKWAWPTGIQRASEHQCRGRSANTGQPHRIRRVQIDLGNGDVLNPYDMPMLCCPSRWARTTGSPFLAVARSGVSIQDVTTMASAATATVTVSTRPGCEVATWEHSGHDQRGPAVVGVTVQPQRLQQHHRRLTTNTAATSNFPAHPRANESSGGRQRPGPGGQPRTLLTRWSRALDPHQQRRWRGNDTCHRWVVTPVLSGRPVGQPDSKP